MNITQTSKGARGSRRSNKAEHIILKGRRGKEEGGKSREYGGFEEADEAICAVPYPDGFGIAEENGSAGNRQTSTVFRNVS
jgi:hypothetical protein